MQYKHHLRFRYSQSLYLTLIMISLLFLFPLSAKGDSAYREQTRSIFVFENEVEADFWIIVNDSVMGGISQSDFNLTEDGTARFQGNVSLENYGGFASVRTYPIDYRLSGYDGFKIRVKGDGNRYKLRLRMGRYFNGVAYEAELDTELDTWLTIRIPFDEFVPVYRGRRLSYVPALNPANITQIGLMISDKQEGRFELEIDQIDVYRWTPIKPLTNYYL